MFDVPVCNSFKAKILNDQLCYEIDVNQYIVDKKDVEMVNKIGLTLILDYNEERQISNSTFNSGSENIISWTEMPNIENSASFYIDTNGKHYFLLVNLILNYRGCVCLSVCHII